jgi:hypothetical protein
MNFEVYKIFLLKLFDEIYFDKVALYYFWEFLIELTRF